MTDTLVLFLHVVFVHGTSTVAEHPATDWLNLLQTNVAVGSRRVEEFSSTPSEAHYEDEDERTFRSWFRNDSKIIPFPPDYVVLSQMMRVDTAPRSCQENKVPDFACDNMDRRAQCSHCGRDQQKCDSSLYMDSDAEKGKLISCCEKQNLLNILEFVDSTLCGKVKYSIMYGTLLAAIRKQDLIDWDSDVDIVIDHKDAQRAHKLITDASHKFGFKVGDLDSKRFRVNWGNTNLLHLDVWLLTDLGLCSSSHKELFPTQWLLPLGSGSCLIQGRKFSCPVDISMSKTMLDYLYGPTWPHSRHGESNRCALKHGPKHCNAHIHGFSCTTEKAKTDDGKKLVA